MIFNRGDIVIVEFPDSNLRTAKRRPAIVVQANRLNTGLPQQIVAMISSNLRRSGHPSRISITMNSTLAQKSGLVVDSVIMTDNLATVYESEIARVIGAFSDLSLLDAALRHTLEL